MDFKQLLIMTAIVEEGNLTAAAKRLHIAQPALSNHLKVLEDELGARLMHRGSRKMTLTDEGRILYQKAQQILDLADSVQKEISDYHNGLKGTLRVGHVPIVESTLFDGKLIRFNRENPQIRYEMHTGNTYEILDLLYSGAIEVGIVRTPFNTTGLDIRYWDREPLIAMYSKTFNLPTGQDRITVGDLKDKPLIMVRRLEQLVTYACHGAGFRPNILCLNDYLPVNLIWAEAGLGIAIVPQSALKLMEARDMTYRIIDEPSFSTQNALISIKGKYLSTIARKFIEILADKSAF